MKKGIITMMALMLGMSGMMAQNTVVATGSGDVTIKLGEAIEVKCDGDPITISPDDRIVLTSYKDYEVTIPELKTLKVTGTGDVESQGIITAPYLDILISGTGDAKLTVECDTLKAKLTGIGDLVLNGHCGYLQATITGLGDLDYDGLTVDSMAIASTQSSLDGPSFTRSHSDNGFLFDPNWSGFDAGPNMLLGADPNANLPAEYALLESRVMKSWNFNFNIADVGLAFTRSHRVGIYSGIGLGWNNYRFETPTRLEKGADKLVCTAIDESVEGRVKKSKLGVLYLQAPLMLEIRPSRRSFIAFGVTGGIRIDAWNKIKFEDGVKIKTHEDYYINRFKLDASLRAGKDDGLGFFANYNLLPLFMDGKGPDVHCASFGISLNF